MRISRKYLLLLFIPLLLAGCVAPPPPIKVLPILTPPVVPPDGEILDLLLLPQDIGAYLKADTANCELPLWPDQQQRAGDYLTRHFAPWDKVHPPPSRSAAYWIVSWLEGKKIFDYTGRPLADARRRELLALADAEHYPSLDLMAITVRGSDSRALPDRRPWFFNPALAGEGLPFDYLQNSAVPPHTPLRVRHRSTDGSWVFAESAAVAGWLPAEDVAFVDEAFISRFRQAAQLTVTGEPVAVTDTSGAFRFSGGLGTFFPLVAEELGGWRVLVAAADPDRRGILREAILPAGLAARFPLPATARNLAALGNPLLGKAYGWGGLYGDRDCSATLRDLFSPFGLWLPRNSSFQAEAGTRISLAGLSVAEKEAFILSSALPLRTLLSMKGHVLLYLGEYAGRPVALHTLWGVRTRDPQGKVGRKVVGRTVITTLQPGIEREDLVVPEGVLLQRIGSMTLLGGLAPLAP